MILGISRSLLVVILVVLLVVLFVVLLLQRESSPLHDVPWLGAT